MANRTQPRREESHEEISTARLRPAKSPVSMREDASISGQKSADAALGESEEALRQSRRTLSTLMGNLPGMAYRCRNDKDWSIEFVSAGCRELTGYEPADLIDNRRISYGDIIHPEDRRAAWEAVQSALARNEPFRLAYRITTAGGEERWVWEQGSGVRSEDQELLCLEGFVCDITEHRRAEDEVRQLNADLERRVGERTRELETLNRELESFSYSVSHDLRAPLRAIQGFSEALVEDCADRLGEDGLDYLSRIRAAAERMGRLIDDLLTLSRTMRAAPQRRQVDLSTLARAVANDLQQRHAARQVEVVIQEDLLAEVDDNLMRTALENLLENAWKYTAKHDRARVEFGVAGERAGSRVYVVRDDGAGFDMAHAGRLFTPFQRLHAPSEFAGDGIGLATVARIIRCHGGEIWAEAAPERGASFFFTLGESGPRADV